MDEKTLELIEAMSQRMNVLIDLLENKEIPLDENYRTLSKLAQKAAKTGNLKDLQAYLKARKELL